MIEDPVESRKLEIVQSELTDQSVDDGMRSLCAQAAQ